MSNNWTEIELEDSIRAYLEMQNKIANGEKVVKKEFYQNLSSKHNRTVKAFEYRMQNISHVLSLQGRNWIPGLPPATNVGANVAKQIELILSKLEQRPLDAKLIFESKVNDLLKRKSIEKPNGNKKPQKREANVFEYDRDPNVKAWVLKNANGVCENCQQEAPFTTKSGVPYLEVHHVCRLSDNGSDTVQNTVALCPNCHKEIHYGEQKQVIQDKLYETIERLIKEN